MLAYAASRPVAAQRRSSPNAMLAIIAAHVAVVAVVMSAKMDVNHHIFDPPTIIETIKFPPPPPADPVKPTVKTPTVVHPLTPLPQPLPDDPIVLPQPTPDPGPLVGPSIDPVPNPTPTKQMIPVRLGPRLLTPATEIKPPYPDSKLAAGEEALLKLRLTIDESGRVVAVEPVGRSDSVFLAAARRHLLTHWRYKPASEDGRAVTSSIVITLRFQLDA